MPMSYYAYKYRILQAEFNPPRVTALAMVTWSNGGIAWVRIRGGLVISATESPLSLQNASAEARDLLYNFVPVV